MRRIESTLSERRRPALTPDLSHRRPAADAEALHSRPEDARSAPRRYRIAFLGGRGLGRPHGGIETFYDQAGSRLAARGHEMTVYCRPRFTPSAPRYRGMRVRPLPTIGSKHLETLVHSGLSALHAATRAYDIVHIHAIGSSVFALLPRLLGRRTVVTVHSLDWQFPKWNALARRCLQFAEWTSVAWPTRTIAVSHALAAYLSRKYDTSVDVVPNGVTIEPPRSPARILDLALIPGSYVLYVGRLSEEKGCHQLISAFERADVPGVELVVAGGARYASAYERELRAIAGPRVRFLGWVDRSTLAELYSSCALFVLPSNLEGLCLALLEAMSYGAPVLVSDIAPNREAVRDAGFLFRAGDVADLYRQLGTLLSDAQLRGEAGLRARRRARAHYAWDVVVRRLEAVYDSLFEVNPTDVREARR